MSRILVHTKDMPREEWLRYRRMGIGGSDAGAIVGLNPYVTPYSLWADKTGRLPDREDNEAMRQGRDLEEYVAQRFEEASGKKVRRRNAMFQHNELDFAVANIDREVVGERAGLECKTTSVMNLRKFRNGEFPDQYYTQCVHYLAVTGWDRWYLAVLILNQGFYIYEIERDEDEISALMTAEKEFWETYIVPDEAPPVDGRFGTDRAIREVFQDPDGGECELIGAGKTVENLLSLRKARKELNQEIRRLEQELKVELGECETGYCGRYEVRWRRTKRAAVSVEKLKQKYPKIDLNKVMKVSTGRRFAVVEHEEE